MSLTSQQYANLADHTYDRRGDLAQLARDQETFGIEGERYKVLAFRDNPVTGYQGTIYQHVESGVLVVAHRGTEFGREAFQDGLLADAGMVLARTNLQADDAIALTREALQRARDVADDVGGRAPEVTVTGHSLGGALAQISAHYFDLRGETFNAYGAVSLDRRIPEGGDRVLNHVMASDFVSAASPHYGQVRVYARDDEIERLHLAGYHNHRLIDALRPDLPILAAGSSFGAHSMHHFTHVDGEGRPDRSVLEDAQARQLAQAQSRMIADYRDDVGQLRWGVTAGASGLRALRAPAAVMEDLARDLRGPLEAGEPASRERRAVPEGGMRGEGTSAQVSRLLDSVGGNDPAALRAALAEFSRSTHGQAWQAQVASHRQALEDAAKTPDWTQDPAPQRQAQEAAPTR